MMLTMKPLHRLVASLDLLGRPQGLNKATRAGLHVRGLDVPVAAARGSFISHS